MFVFALVVGVVLLGVSFTLIARAIGAGARSAEVLDQIGAYGFTGTTGAVPDAGERRAAPLSDVAATVGDIGARWFGRMREDEVRRRLIQAGWYGTTARAFLGYQLIAAIGVCFLWILVGGRSSTSAVVYAFGILVTALFGWYLPSILLSRSAKQRHHRIDRDLPELIDLLVVTVEAGVGFVGSMRMAAQQLEGPLAEELRLTLQEQSMGLSSAEALEGMLKRADTPGIRQFVRAITQGETLGVSIGQILRNLADEMRKRRKAKAEELAQKAPVKMLFPLIFLIFPAMFVVLLLPAIIAIAETLGS